jgi:retron-type reverse transcriptase
MPLTCKNGQKHSNRVDRLKEINNHKFLKIVDEVSQKKQVLKTQRLQLKQQRLNVVSPEKEKTAFLPIQLQLVQAHS